MAKAQGLKPILHSVHIYSLNLNFDTLTGSEVVKNVYKPYE